MARSVQVRSSFVYSTVDLEARRIHGYFVATDDLTIFINMDHVTSFEHAKVHAEPTIL